MNDKPQVIVAGSAIWPIIQSNGSLNSVQDYITNLTQLIKVSFNLFLFIQFVI